MGCSYRRSGSEFGGSGRVKRKKSAKVLEGPELGVISVAAEESELRC